VAWSSKRQTTVSRSSAEAKYRTVANATVECCWLQQLLQELHVVVNKASVMYCDNISAVYLSHNPVHHRRTKHVEIDIHFVWGKGCIGRATGDSCAHQFAICGHHDKGVTNISL
jgi:hypothetical protein